MTTPMWRTTAKHVNGQEYVTAWPTLGEAVERADFAIGTEYIVTVAVEPVEIQSDATVKEMR